MPIRLPSYVYRNRCGIFCFRVVFPRALSQREVRVSLRTADRAAAISLARYLSHRVQSLFDSFRAMTDDTKTTDVQHFKLWLKAVSERYTLKERLEELEELRLDELYHHRRALADQAQASQAERSAAHREADVRELPGSARSGGTATSPEAFVPRRSR